MSGTGDAFDKATSLGRFLAHSEKSVREKTIKNLARWLKARTDATALEYLKLWKGLYFCMWLTDKSEVQVEIATQLSQLIHVLDPTQAELFYRSFFTILRKEWVKLDFLRVDKFLYLVRFMIREALLYMHNQEWDEEVVDALQTALLETVLEEKPDGIRSHVCDIYNDIIADLFPEMPTGMYLTLIQPFLEYLTQKREGEKIFFQSLMKRVILDGLDRIVEAAAERVKRMNKQGGEDEDEEEDEEEEEDEDKEEEDEEKAIPFVHVNGPKILKVLLEIGGDEDIMPSRRRSLYEAVRVFTDSFTQLTVAAGGPLYDSDSEEDGEDDFDINDLEDNSDFGSDDELLDEDGDEEMEGGVEDRDDEDEGDEEEEMEAVPVKKQPVSKSPKKKEGKGAKGKSSPKASAASSTPSKPLTNGSAKKSKKEATTTSPSTSTPKSARSTDASPNSSSKKKKVKAKKLTPQQQQQVSEAKEDGITASGSAKKSPKASPKAVKGKKDAPSSSSSEPKTKTPPSSGESKKSKTKNSAPKSTEEETTSIPVGSKRRASELEATAVELFPSPSNATPKKSRDRTTPPKTQIRTEVLSSAQKRVRIATKQNKAIDYYTSVHRLRTAQLPTDSPGIKSALKVSSTPQQSTPRSARVGSSGKKSSGRGKGKGKGRKGRAQAADFF